MTWLAYIGAGLLGLWTVCRLFDVLADHRERRRAVERRLREWVG